jgi:ferredoxin
MIVGEQKPIEEIWSMVKDFKKVLVFGCNTCVAVCHAGGSKEAEIIASLIRIKAKEESVGMTVEHGACERQCEPEFFMPLLEKFKAQDLVLSIACGVGVNLMSSQIGEIPVYPGLNTEFYGAVPQAGVFVEMCGGCGNCILHLTGGICPIVRCSKSLLNGPCGGTNNGKCEISNEVDCAWYLIVERMKKLGTLDKLLEIQPPKNWATATAGGPRRVVLEHIAKLEEKENTIATGEVKK